MSEEKHAIDVLNADGTRAIPISKSASGLTVNQVRERLKVAGGDLLLCLASIMNLPARELERTGEFGTVKEKIVCQIAKRAIDGDEVAVELVFNRLCGKQRASLDMVDSYQGSGLEDFLKKIEERKGISHDSKE